MTLAIDSRIDLRHGGPMPLFGLGTYRTPRGGATRDAVLAAIDAGYRSIDTAAQYGNEAEVGAAVRQSGVAREDVFVTTKLHQGEHGDARALRAFEGSLERLALDYVDLFLVHWPGGGERAATWRALEHILHDGRVRAIGVSNYMVRHLDEMLGYSSVLPAVNQIEIHPFNYESRTDVVEFCRAHTIAVEGYSPLAKAHRLDDPTVVALAARIDRTPAQVMIRWSLQHSIITIPKSADDARIRENAGVFDFALTDSDMRRLDDLDEDFITSWDPRQVD